LPDGETELPVFPYLVFVQIFFRHIIFGDFVGVDFLAFVFVGFFDTRHDSGLERVALFQEFVNTL
jgi:hypothetical protein